MLPIDRIEAGNVLGECVLWDELTQSLWWTDIEGRVLHRFDWRKVYRQDFVLSRRLASFGFVEDRPELIGAFDDGFALFDPVAGEICPCLKPEGLEPGLRLNDGRVDRKGRFWAGSMVETVPRAGAARLYCLGPGGAETREEGIKISNGLCWSPDGTVCYFADSGAGVIWRYRFEIDTGRLHDRTEFVRTREPGVPDGATVDADGFLWSAQWGGGAVIRYAPDGRVDRVVPVPVSQPTCVAFGGPSLDLLFVTSAKTGLAVPETGAGDVFVYNAGVRGLAESRFKIGGWPQNACSKG